MEAKPRVEVGDFLGISIASVIVSSLELRHSPKDEMFGTDKGFKCPNLPWTAPGFQAMKGIIHAPCAKPALRPKAGTLCSLRSPKLGDGSTTSGSAAFRTSWTRACLACGAAGAGAVVGFGRGVQAERDGFAL